MTIEEDANVVLDFMFKEYLLFNKRTTTRGLLDQFSDWDGRRLDRAVKYLRDIYAIEVIHTFGNENGLQNFILKKITPSGIQMAESRVKTP